MNNADIGVLLLDDDEMIRDCVTAYLEDEGFTVYGASTAEEALHSIAANWPAVCIADMCLPGINGEKFITLAYAFSPTTGFMLHTGMMYSLSDQLRAIGMTNDDVLQKPVHDLAKLVQRIKLIAAAGRIV